jgi:glycerol-3-phosphate dehydrogenase subunit C
MAREKALRAKKEGVPCVDQILGEPLKIGKFGSGVMAPMANLVNANRLARKVAEKVTGISAEFKLPPLTSKPFRSWFKKHEPLSAAGEAGEVVLFATCYGQYNFPEVPNAAVRVLGHNGFKVTYPEEQDCCGMPNLDGGDIEAAQQKMQRNVDLLFPYAERGLPIVVIGPTCGYTMKKEWPQYLGTPEAARVASGTVDLMQFLDGLRREKKLKQDFQSSLGKVVYHAACHLRAQKIAVPGARVLGRVPDTDVRIVERCSAVDGTWGMKAAYYEEGRRYARKLVEEFSEDPDAVFVGDCSLASLRLEKELGRGMLHPAQALAKAYGLEID